MTETEENTSIEKEKNQKKVVVIVTVALVCLIAIFAAVKVYTSPARQLQRQLDLGNRYLEGMDYEQAIVAFDKAIEIDPKNADVYLGKADAYVGLGDSAMAIETLEAGYQATEEDEAIKGRLLTVYATMVEDAIERGSYEEGMKAYERIVELDGEDEKFRNRLEALLDHGSGEGDTSDETAEGESGLPYFELGFSPEDFTIAGYSIKDGNHINEIEQAAAAIMPDRNEDTLTADYMGWCYGDMPLINGIEMNYYFPENIDGYDYSFSTGAVGYEADGTHFYVGYFEENFEQDVMLDAFPLYEGKVIPNATSYEETQDILGIRELIQAVEGHEFLKFKSQYGDGECYNYGYDDGYSTEGYHSYSISFREWSTTMDFHNNVLWMISFSKGDIIEESIIE